MIHISELLWINLTHVKCFEECLTHCKCNMSGSCHYDRHPHYIVVFVQSNHQYIVYLVFLRVRLFLNYLCFVTTLIQKEQVGGVEKILEAFLRWGGVKPKHKTACLVTFYICVMVLLERLIILALTSVISMYYLRVPFEKHTQELTLLSIPSLLPLSSEPGTKQQNKCLQLQLTHSSYIITEEGVVTAASMTQKIGYFIKNYNRTGRILHPHHLSSQKGFVPHFIKNQPMTIYQV